MHRMAPQTLAWTVPGGRFRPGLRLRHQPPASKTGISSICRPSMTTLP